MASLIPCSACERFVRASDSECPFCGAAVTAPTVRKRVFRGSRAALVAAAVGAVGCTDDGGAMDAGIDASVQPVYGGPDAGPTDAGPIGVDAVYGGPAVDSGVDGGPVDAGPEDAGPTDAGPTDAGPIGVDAVYGGPPADGG